MNENTNEKDELKLEGRNPVIEALKADRTIDKLFVAKGEAQGSMGLILRLAREKHIVIQEVDRRKLDELSETGAHQGVVAFTAGVEYVEVEDIINFANEKGEDPLIIIADEINDPHNLGSIIRTANCVGAHGVIIPKRRSVGISTVVAKTAAGALEYVKIAKVTNLSQTIEKLKEKGIWVAAVDMDGDVMYSANLTGPLALVIGSEGAGIGQLIKKSCDFNVSIPMSGDINSLNASVAAAVMMYEVSRQRNFKKSAK